MSIRSTLARGIAAIVLLIAGVASAFAAEDDFYKGKTLTMIVGYAPGGVNDIAARLMGKYMVKYLPGNPNLVVQNMPAASGVSAINHMYNVAPKDGTTVAIIGRAIPQLAYLGDPNIRFNPDKFIWLGSISSYAEDAYPIFIMADRPVKSWQDIKPPSTKKIVLGAVGPGSTNLTFALIAKDVLKLNVDVVRGYTGAAPLFLGMQNGELDGQVVGFASLRAGQRALWDNHQVRALIQFGRTTRLKELPDVPTGQELASNADDLTLIKFAEAPFYMALPFIAPPDIPADRAKMLRTAFEKSYKDKDFIAEAKKLELDVSPIDGDAVAKLVKDMAGASPAVLERFKSVSGMR